MHLCELCVANGIRVVCLVLSIIVAGLSLGAVHYGAARGRAQKFRFLGLAVLAVGLSFGAYHSLGHDPYWPYLILVMIGVSLSVLGTFPMVRRRIHKD